jgi:hypothetical protein
MLAQDLLENVLHQHVGPGDDVVGCLFVHLVGTTALLYQWADGAQCSESCARFRAISASVSTLVRIRILGASLT